MNKRYMDFVPVSATHKIVRDDVDEPKKSKSVVNKTKKVAPKKVEEPAKETFEPQFGVIEDLQPKFVKTEVAKRPLGGSGAAKKASDEADESNKIKKAAEDKIYRDAIRKAEAAVSDANETAEKEPKHSTGLSQRTEMKTPFVNTEKVAKRPLSKNVYPKKVVVPKAEEPKPITIITSEKKDSKIGIVVAVIITIILGATAGTVAFLLLPK